MTHDPRQSHKFDHTDRLNHHIAMKNATLLMLGLMFSVAALAQFTSTGLSATPILGSAQLSSGTSFIAPFEQGFLLYDEGLTLTNIIQYPILPNLQPGRLVGINVNDGSGAGDVPFDRLGYLSETLFDTDPTTQEYAVLMSNTSTSRWDLLVARTDGSVLFYLPSTAQTEYWFQSIVNTSSGTKLVVTYVDWSFFPETAQIGQVFELPGSLPCPDCLGSELMQGSSNDLRTNTQPEKRKITPFSVHPNPSDGGVSIRYSLPIGTERAVLRMVDAHGKNVVRSTLTSNSEQTLFIPNLSPGGYVCILEHENGMPIGPGQLVVIL